MHGIQVRLEIDNNGYYLLLMSYKQYTFYLELFFILNTLLSTFKYKNSDSLKKIFN